MTVAIFVLRRGHSQLGNELNMIVGKSNMLHTYTYPVHMRSTSIHKGYNLRTTETMAQDIHTET